MEAIWMIQKTAAIDNWWLAASSRQSALSGIMSGAVFLARHQITQVTHPPYSTNMASWDFWLFLKLKSPLKGKRFQIINEIHENMTEQLKVTGRIVWGPQVPILKESEVSLSCVCSFYLVSSSINVWTNLVNTIPRCNSLLYQVALLKKKQGSDWGLTAFHVSSHSPNEAQQLYCLLCLQGPFLPYEPNSSPYSAGQMSRINLSSFASP